MNIKLNEGIGALLAAGVISGYDNGPGATGLQGYNQQADILVQAADGTDLFTIFDEINQTLAEWNASRNKLIGAISYYTTDTTEVVGVPGSTDFEEATEFGQPVGGGGYSWFNRGYDFKFYDLAMRFTYRYLANASGDQIRMLANEALEADNRLLFNKVMKTLYNPLNLAGIADKNIPSTVYKFYNGDGEVPPPYEGNTFVGTHTHYSTTQTLASSATLTSATLDAVELDFLKHGNTPYLNGTELILMVKPQEGAIIRQFRVATGAKYDFIPGPAYGGGLYLPQNGGIINRPEGEVHEGQIGTYGPWKIIEKQGWLVDGYLVFLASGGTNSLKNPVGIREHINSTQQGLKLIPGSRSDYPLVDSFYTRGFGTGIRQRGAGFIVQVTNNASYTTPSQYV